MAEYTVTPGNAAGREPPVTAGLMVYVLFAVAAIAALVSHGLPLIAPLFGLIGIIAIVVAYVKRSEAEGTWVASHLRWLIRTFWWSLLWAALGALVFITLIGIPIAFAVWIVDTLWVFYRLIKGFLLFQGSRPVPGL
jgi:uncharacterized membrane protein